MQRFLPLLVVLLLLIALGALYGPAAYRNYLFQRDVEAMLASARAGNTQGIANAALAAQRADALAILTQYLPADYAGKIAKLTLGSTQEVDARTRYALVTCRIEAGEGIAIYSGKLKWTWTGERWEWDFFGSYAAPFQPSGEPSWIELDELLPQAGY